MFYLKINCKPGNEFKTDDDVDSDNLTPAGERDVLMLWQVDVDLVLQLVRQCGVNSLLCLSKTVLDFKCNV